MDDKSDADREAKRVLEGQQYDEATKVDAGTYQIPAACSIVWLKTLASGSVLFRVECRRDR